MRKRVLLGEGELEVVERNFAIQNNDVFVENTQEQ